MTNHTRLGLATILAAVFSAPLALAQNADTPDEGQNGTMSGDMSGMVEGDMSGMMGMMQMMEQMSAMMEACTEMMQAMSNPMEPSPDTQDGLDSQG